MFEYNLKICLHEHMAGVNEVEKRFISSAVEIYRRAEANPISCIEGVPDSNTEGPSNLTKLSPYTYYRPNWALGLSSALQSRGIPTTLLREGYEFHKYGAYRGGSYNYLNEPFCSEETSFTDEGKNKMCYCKYRGDYRGWSLAGRGSYYISSGGDHWEDGSILTVDKAPEPRLKSRILQYLGIPEIAAETHPFYTNEPYFNLLPSSRLTVGQYIDHRSDVNSTKRTISAAAALVALDIFPGSYRGHRIEIPPEALPEDPHEAIYEARRQIR
jgi:hypothetical protein